MLKCINSAHGFYFGVKHTLWVLVNQTEWLQPRAQGTRAPVLPELRTLLQISTFSAASERPPKDGSHLKRATVLGTPRLSQNLLKALQGYDKKEALKRRVKPTCHTSIKGLVCSCERKNSFDTQVTAESARCYVNVLSITYQNASSCRAFHPVSHLSWIK